MMTRSQDKIATPDENGLIGRFESLSIPQSVLSLVPYNLAVEYFVLPYAVDERGRIEALMAYPSDSDTLQCIQLITGVPIKPRAVSKEDLLKLVAHHYGSPARQKTVAARAASEAPRLSVNRSQSTINVVNDIVNEAVRLQASDIHLEPFEREMAVRFRIDGVLQHMSSIARERIAETTSRVKVMAGMDIAERRRAQDGRIRLGDQGRDVDIRVSALPTDFGEKIVLRLLDKSSFDFSLDNIGMAPRRLALFKKAIQMPNGIVLLTGPTGSGKTTTLYGAINYLKKPGINISTVEDPLEYNIDGVNQTQVNRATGMTFAHSLRTLLRQDPDVIMVGEMRDRETAEIAIRSSLTGHLVLSTLHTNDSASAATRLVDMGIEPYLVASSVTLVVAQRLVRRVCEHCKCEEIVSDDIRGSIGVPPDVTLYKGLGCSRCGHTGYKGRTGIFEVLPITDEVRKLIHRKAYAGEIRDRAAAEGLVSLRENAVSKLTLGGTSLEEVLREISVVS